MDTGEIEVLRGNRELLANVAAIADAEGVSQEEIVNRAIGVFIRLKDISNEPGAIVFVIRQDGSKSELDFSSMFPDRNKT